MSDSFEPIQPRRRFSALDFIEFVGNKLPDPVTLFAIGALLVMVLSLIAVWGGWRVEQEMPRPVEEVVLDSQGVPLIDEETGEVVTRPIMEPVLDAEGNPLIDEETGEVVKRQVVEWQKTGVVFEPENLLSREGINWALRTMVDNFRMFPPLGVVLVGMLGIGIAERTGLLAAALKGFMLGLRGFCESFTPRRWGLADKLLTPTMVFIGIMSSMATDAGYVVLPPLAAALYKSVGRSPLAGMAAVFAGVSAGFCANLFITGLEPMLAELTGIGAVIIDPGYRVNPACNWWFMIGSTVVITLTGWVVTSRFVERRLKTRAPEEGGPTEPTEDELAEQRLKPEESRGLMWAGTAAAIAATIILGLILIPRMPLYTYHMPGTTQIAEIWVAEPGAVVPDNAVVVDEDLILVPSERIFPRWVDAIVPLLFFGFLIPGLAYGIASKTIRSDKDAAKLMIEAMAAMAPIIVLAFVAGQFIAYFSYSGLDRMMAMAGGMWLGKAGFSPYMLVVAFIGVTLIFNLFMGSMSAKYTLFAPIFIPMFMLVGISPELTQAAYRIGDSVSNIITPLNAYLIIILVFMQKYVPKGGMGTLIATMFPYTIAFGIVWTIFLLIWMQLGIPLGIDGGLWYELPAQ